MRKTLLMLVLLGLSSIPLAHAGRVFPADAKAGVLKDFAYPMVLVDGNAYRLAPGALIYDRFNRTVAPNYLPQGAKVLFRIDGQGHLSRMWLLTPEEASAISQH